MTRERRKWLISHVPQNQAHMIWKRRKVSGSLQYSNRAGLQQGSLLLVAMSHREQVPLATYVCVLFVYMYTCVCMHICVLYHVSVVCVFCMCHVCCVFPCVNVPCARDHLFIQSSL